MTEAEIQDEILLRFGREPDMTLWRQNTGVSRSEVVTRAHLERILGWLLAGGGPDFRSAQALITSLLAEKHRFTPFGLCKGSSDIVGIVQTMSDASGCEACCQLSDIGSSELQHAHRPPLGIFVALEVKRPGNKPTGDQQRFLDIVNRRGGIGRCVHSVDEAASALSEARRR